MIFSIESVVNLGKGTHPNIVHDVNNDLLLYYIEDDRVKMRKFTGYFSGAIQTPGTDMNIRDDNIGHIRLKKLAHHGAYGFCSIGTYHAFVTYNLDIALQRSIVEDSFDFIEFSSFGAIVTGCDLTFMASTVDGIVESDTIDGSFDLASQLSERNFNLTVMVAPDDPSKLDEYVQNLCLLFYKDGPGLLRLEKFPAGTMMICELNGEISTAFTPGYCELSIPLVCTSGVLYQDGDEVILKGDGRAFNSGNISVGPIFTLQGPASHPYIYIGDTYFEYTGEVAAGANLIVDCENKMAYIDGANALKFSNREFPVLKPGENTISHTSGTLVTQWRPAFLSI